MPEILSNTHYRENASTLLILIAKSESNFFQAYHGKQPIYYLFLLDSKSIENLIHSQ